MAPLKLFLGMPINFLKFSSDEIIMSGIPSVEFNLTLEVMVILAKPNFLQSS